MLYRTTVHLRKEDLEYAQTLADAYEVSRNLIIRLLLERAIELHQNGKLEIFRE